MPPSILKPLSKSLRIIPPNEYPGRKFVEDEYIESDKTIGISLPKPGMINRICTPKNKDKSSLNSSLYSLCPIKEKQLDNKKKERANFFKLFSYPCSVVF